MGLNSGSVKGNSLSIIPKQELQINSFLRNYGGSGYVTIEYYSDYSGVLLKETYYMESGSSKAFSEKLDIRIEDDRVGFRITDQRAS